MTFCFLPPRPEQEREREIYYPVLNFFCRFGAGAASQSELSGGPWGSGRVAPPIWRSADKAAAAAAAAEHCVFPFEIPRDGLPPPRPHPHTPPKLIYLLIALFFYPFLSLSLFCGYNCILCSRRSPLSPDASFRCFLRLLVEIARGGGGGWRLRFCAVCPPNLAVLPLLGI